MSIEYVEVDAASVMKFFTDAFEANVIKHEYFYDVNKGIIVFKLYIDNDTETT